jgi:hypothetical protein
LELGQVLGQVLVLELELELVELVLVMAMHPIYMTNQVVQKRHYL